MFDIHCHICYGSDDGAENLETAVEMVALARECGTTGIAATPHCNVPGSYGNYWDETLKEKIALLRSTLSERKIPVEIYEGQEIFCTDKTARLLREGKLITLNGSRYPLIEFDFYEYAQDVYEKLRAITAEGCVPVVAHPERYAFVAEEEDAVFKLKNIGCLLQVNKGSLEGRFGRDAFFASRRLMELRLADAVASDAHSPYMRTPDMRHAHELICEEYSYDYAEFLLEENPRRILRDEDTNRY
ncbi:MAG: hypothetical protein IJK89_11140 [Clostridia bacterium]|nr:hypothetical protein [Clostridia bacterium]